MVEERDLNGILKRSEELYAIIFHYVYSTENDGALRSELTKAMAGISLEHAQSMQILMKEGNYTTAVSLLRLQFEAATRSHWLHFSANNGFIEKYHNEKATVKNPPDFPTVTEMIDEMKAEAISGPGQMLQTFKDMAWKGMNNFVHSSSTPIWMVRNGYPNALLVQIWENSNSLNIMVAMVLARLSGDMDVVNLVRTLQTEFRDCTPILVKP